MTTLDTIRVLIVDDHDMVRVGLETLLEVRPELELVGLAASGKEALAMCAENCPDVALMDMFMPELDGVETTKCLLEQHPDVQVIALTSYDDKELVQNALQAGAISYLLKNVSTEEMIEAIHKAFHGKATLVPEATQALVEATQAPPKPGSNLTEREQDVLELIVEGLSNREIAQKLHVSRSTVKHHVSSVLHKLNVASRAEAAVLAVRNKLDK